MNLFMRLSCKWFIYTLLKSVEHIFANQIQFLNLAFYKEITFHARSDPTKHYITTKSENQ